MSMKKKTVTVGAGVIALALAGGIAAQFTTSTTSAPQKIGTGTLSIDFQNESAAWTQGITNLAAGDTDVVDVDFVNTGTLTLDDSVRFSVQDTVVGGLTADLNGAETRDDSLRVKISSAKGTAYDGPVTALFGQGQVVPAGLLGLGAGDSTHLTFAYTIPASAGNDYQAKTAHLNFTAEAVQRVGNGANSGQTPAPTTPAPAPSTPAIDYTAATWSTTSAAAMPTDGHHGYTATASDGKGTFYVLGGRVTSPVPSAKVDMYSAATNTWTTMGDMPEGRAGAAATMDSKGNIYVVGGWTPSGTQSKTNDLRYDAATKKWSTIAPVYSAMSSGDDLKNAPSLVADAEGNVYYIGGGEDPNRGGYASNNVYRYSPQSNTWTKMASTLDQRGSTAAVLGKDGNIYVFGGIDAQMPFGLSSAEKYDVKTNTWTKIANMPNSRLGNTAQVGADGSIYVMGGSGFMFNPVTAVDRYDPKTDSWTTMSATAPAMEMYAMSAIDGQGRLYLFGGTDNFEYGGASSTMARLG